METTICDRCKVQLTPEEIESNRLLTSHKMNKEIFGGKKAVIVLVELENKSLSPTDQVNIPDLCAPCHASFGAWWLDPERLVTTVSNI